jgi:hypothetical protein
VICQACRIGGEAHALCPELARQRSDLPAYVKAGSKVCDCRHRAVTSDSSTTTTSGENMPNGTVQVTDVENAVREFLARHPEVTGPAKTELEALTQALPKG